MDRRSNLALTDRAPQSGLHQTWKFCLHVFYAETPLRLTGWGMIKWFVLIQLERLGMVDTAGQHASCAKFAARQAEAFYLVIVSDYRSCGQRGRSAWPKCRKNTERIRPDFTVSSQVKDCFETQCAVAHLSSPLLGAKYAKSLAILFRRSRPKVKSEHGKVPYFRKRTGKSLVPVEPSTNCFVSGPRGSPN